MHIIIKKISHLFLLVGLCQLGLLLDISTAQEKAEAPAIPLSTKELLKGRFSAYEQDSSVQATRNNPDSPPPGPLSENLSYKKEFLCPKCYEKTTFSGNKAKLLDEEKAFKANVDGLNKIVKEKKLNLSFTLDPTNFCAQCSPGKKERCFHLRTIYFDPKTGAILSEHRARVDYADFFALSSFLINKKLFIDTSNLDPQTKKLIKGKKQDWLPVRDKLPSLKLILGL